MTTLLHKMFEQFENIGGAEKLGPTTSMMIISIWRKAEKMNNQNKFSMSDKELMVLSGITQVSQFQHSLNQLVKHGYIRYQYDGGNLKIKVNFNLYKPFPKPNDKKETYESIVETLETHFIRLRGTGVFLSPIDYEEMQKIARTEITAEQAVEWLNECFENYIPRYKGDSIKSFKYCSSYLKNKLNQYQSKERGFTNAENGQNNVPIYTTIIAKKSRTSKKLREREERLRKKGFLHHLGDVNPDF